MPASKYKLLTIGSPVGLGVTNSVFVAMSGVAKKATAASPFIVASEFFCSSIARQLLLPCPPGAVTDINDEIHFFSLDFNLAGMSLPPTDSAALAAFDTSLCWRIIVFDAFVMNSDRHAQNISHDTTTHETQIFDHSHALLGAGTDYAPFWAQSTNSLGIGGHCLAGHINSLIGMEEAIRRVETIQDYVIEGLVDECCHLGFPSAEKNTFVNQMTTRRATLRTLFNANMNVFPKVQLAI